MLAQLERWEEAGYRASAGVHGEDAVQLLDRPGASSARRPGMSSPVREVRLAAGAGFVVAICGEIMTMPGLPRVPAAEGMRLDAEGRVQGLS